MITDASRTYLPDATECVKGHPFRSEADCLLPDDWDQFMCRRCVDQAIGDPE